MRRILPLLLALSVTLPAMLVAQGDTTVQSPLQSDTAVPSAVLKALRETIAERYVTRVPSDSLARFKTAEALLASLGDRHTMLFSPKAFRDFQELQANISAASAPDSRCAAIRCTSRASCRAAPRQGRARRVRPDRGRERQLPGRSEGRLAVQHPGTERTTCG